MMDDTQKNKKFKVVTLGCRTNQYESQAYHDQLAGIGYSRVEGGEHADVCIVNTCTVTESADHQSRYEIRKLARENPGTKLVVTGCAAENHSQAIREIEGVSHVVANRDKDRLVQELFPEIDVPEFEIRQFEAHTRAFVKVQDGCNSFCTYCIIPYVRGRSRSRSMADVIQEVEGLVANGYKEVVLTGINIGDFDGNKPEGERADRLADLVRAVDKVPGIQRIRVSSIDPDEVDDDLADAILNGRHTCHSMHIVLQAGSNVILKRMNRKYTRQIFMETVERLRAASPDFTFTTDVIVGFPGETDADFAETVAVMEEVLFAKVHLFPYSERARTRAALMTNKVPEAVIKERKHKLLQIAEQTAHALRERYVGRRMTVLTERVDDEGVTGHTDNFLTVNIPGYDKSNELIEVDLIANTAQGLTGKIET